MFLRLRHCTCGKPSTRNPEIKVILHKKRTRVTCGPGSHGPPWDTGTVGHRGQKKKTGGPEGEPRLVQTSSGDPQLMAHQGQHGGAAVCPHSLSSLALRGTPAGDAHMLGIVGSLSHMGRTQDLWGGVQMCWSAVSIQHPGRNMKGCQGGGGGIGVGGGWRCYRLYWSRH